MYERQIFPELKLFKKELTERFLIALMEIYRIHPAYNYADDESESSIHISPTYADIRFEGRNPQLLIKVGAYQFNMTDMLNQNAVEEILNKEGIVAGYRYFKNISTTVTVMVRAYAEEESSDIADELSSLGIFTAHHMFAQLGVNIRDSQVSETSEVDNNNDIFETAVSFRVDVPWEFTRTSNEGSDDLEFEFEDGHDEIINNYRRPGVYVFKGSIAQDGKES